MKKSIIILCMFIPSLLPAENDYPIILFHGFFGWGREEMKDYYCWGGEFDLETWLRTQGYEVYTVSLGPISSNWDRAAEAYYQIKGGQLDYGIEHSEKYGLNRQPEGKEYPGLYPEWDADHPIHIIGHSMGGLTARMLEYLLMTEFPGEESPLLSGPHNGWIKSITTLSTPHNGTTLSAMVTDYFPFVQKMATVLGSVQENSFIEKYYDFDLEHWQLDRQEGESILDYFKRLKGSSLRSSRNFCTWDLSLEGAREFNSIYSTHPDTYYFTFTTYATRQSRQSLRHIPDDQMSWNLWSSGFAMGRSPLADADWYENDGVVNTISMLAPFTGEQGPEPFQEFDGTPVTGVWQLMGRLHMDHHRVVGHSHKKDDAEVLMELYGNHCALLRSLD